MRRPVLALTALALLLAGACGDEKDDPSPADGSPGQPDAGSAPDTKASTDGPPSSPDGSPAAGCDPGCLVVSSKPRELLAAPPPEVTTLTEGTLALATKLYGALRAEKPDQNLFYSPHSIQVALAMTYAGARGETANQMASTLELGLMQMSHRAFNGLDQELARRASETPGTMGGEPFQLSVANAIWGRVGYTFLPEFLDVLSLNYGAGLRVLDFASDAEAARQTINQWVEQKTANRIVDLLPQGIVKPDTVLVLTNAIYFKAGWQAPFVASATAPRPFTLLDGQVAQVPTMLQTERLPYVETEDVQAVALPYVGGKLSMLVVAPRPGKLAAFEDGLTAASLDALVAALQPTQVQLAMPKFEFEAALMLRPTLAQLGMPIAFSDAADFSGMNGQGGLTITDVVHKAFVAVDEKGTEAAAATGVVVGPTSAPPPPVEVNLDRPFLFVIRDAPTGAVLFVGRLVDPR